MLRTYADVFQFLTLSSASSYKKILSVTVENGTILSLTIQMLQYFVFLQSLLPELRLRRRR